jgi:ribosomal-protein-alanine N-acetyltransferase
MSEFRLQLARPSDAPAIALVSKAIVEHGLAWRWTPRAVLREIQRRDTEVVVARAGDGRVLGFALMRFEDEVGHLFLLAVVPGARRRGIGAALIGFLEAEARVAGLLTLQLEVRVDNHDAQAFYRRLGFEPARVLHGYYQGVESAVLMTRALGASVH